MYNETQRKAVVKRAMEAVQASIEGDPVVVLGTGATKQSFDLDTGGWCNRFVRQCFETALKLTPSSWPYRGATAHDTIAALKRNGSQVALKQRQPGDILGCPGDPGHIAIYVGDVYGDGRDLVAENTVSTKRGCPRRQGTKVSSFADFAKQHSATWAFRLFA